MSLLYVILELTISYSIEDSHIISFTPCYEWSFTSNHFPHDNTKAENVT